MWWRIASAGCGRGSGRVQQSQPLVRLFEDWLFAALCWGCAGVVVLLSVVLIEESSFVAGVGGFHLLRQYVNWAAGSCWSADREVE